MKVTVNLDRSLLTLKGEPLEEKLSDVLANVLVTSSTSRPAKTIAWAVDFVNRGEAEIDTMDIEFIKEIVVRNNQVIDLAKVQIMEALDNAAKE